MTCEKIKVRRYEIEVHGYAHSVAYTLASAREKLVACSDASARILTYTAHLTPEAIARIGQVETL